eukprot:Nk52_evm35s266 gene=Nk52_evmTU35s266
MTGLMWELYTKRKRRKQERHTIAVFSIPPSPVYSGGFFFSVISLLSFLFLSTLPLLLNTSVALATSTTKEILTWKPFDSVQTTGAVEGVYHPSSSTASGSSHKEPFIVSFGGKSSQGYVNSVRVLNLTTEKWETISVSPTSSPPPVRAYGLGGVNQNLLIVYGGETKDGTVEDLYSLNIDTWTWTFRGNKLANSPGLRKLGSTWVYKDQMYFFGGTTGQHDQNDLSRLDLGTWTFEKISYRCGGLNGAVYTVPYQESIHEKAANSISSTNTNSCWKDWVSRNPMGPPQLAFFGNMLALNEQRASLAIDDAKAQIVANQTAFNADETRCNTIISGGLTLLGQVNAGSGSTAINAKLAEYKAYLQTQKTAMAVHKPSTIPSWAVGGGGSAEYFQCGDWRCLKTDCPYPYPRQGSAASVVGDTVYVTGGYYCGQTASVGPGCADPNVWKLDLKTFEWSLVYNTSSRPDEGVFPSPFSAHAQIVYKDHLLIFGGGYRDAGQESQLFNVPYIFNLTTNSYSILPIHGTAPLPRIDAKAHLVNGRVYISEGRGIPFILLAKSAMIMPLYVLNNATFAAGEGLSAGAIVGTRRSFSLTVKTTVGTYWVGGNKVQSSGFTDKGGFFSAEVSDFLNGTYQVQYTATIAGNYSIIVHLENEDIANSPIRVQIDPGPLSGRNSIAMGLGLVPSNATEDSHPPKRLTIAPSSGTFSALRGKNLLTLPPIGTFKIQGRDQYGNEVGVNSTGGFQVRFLKKLSGGQVEAIEGNVPPYTMHYNAQDNTIRVAYNLPPNEYQVDIKYSNATTGEDLHVLGSPYTLTVPVDNDSEFPIPTYGIALTSGVVFLLLLFLGVLFLRRYRKRKWEQHIANLDWIIDYEELTIIHSYDDFSLCQSTIPSSLNPSSLHDQSRFSASLSLNSKDLDNASGSKDLRQEEINVFAALRSQYCDVVRLNGGFYAFKPLHVKDPIIITTELAVEARHVKDIQHENVNTFLGVVVEPPNCSLLWEYANKGSLRDVIEASDILHDWTLKYSIAQDIGRGLSHIHRSPVGFHGNLTSDNVVINDNWIAKLTDFGLSHIYELEEQAIIHSEGSELSLQENKAAVLYSQFFHAPEFLEEGVRVSHRGSPKGDIYSFAMVITELITLQEPFAEVQEKGVIERETVIERIRANHLRPNLLSRSGATGDIPLPLVNLLKQCWEQGPDDRPTADFVIQRIKALNPNSKQGLVDSMVAILEKYANNLEEIISERTRTLELEKQRSEELALQMLPASVLKQLNLGVTIKPKVFNEVSLYTSDVVGFTRLASKSTPGEIVELLGDFYSAFDKAINAHDAYKVGTIGDAYLIASGVPEENGVVHSLEICRLAIELMSIVSSMEIRHLPGEPLHIRAGCHSGSVTAGVVGSKMPRYWLFGNAVEFTVGLESSSLPMRIQVSEQLYRHMMDNDHMKKSRKAERQTKLHEKDKEEMYIKKAQSTGMEEVEIIDANLGAIITEKPKDEDSEAPTPEARNSSEEGQKGQEEEKEEEEEETFAFVSCTHRTDDIKTYFLI